MINQFYIILTAIYILNNQTVGHEKEDYDFFYYICNNTYKF